MTSPMATDANALWEHGLQNVLAAEAMDRSQFIGVPWISLVSVTHEGSDTSPWNYALPSGAAGQNEFVLYRKSGSSGVNGYFLIIRGRLDWFEAASGGASPSEHFWNEFVGNSVKALFSPANPLVLDPATFDRAAETMYNAGQWLESAAARVQAEANRVGKGSSRFQGAAAEAFVQVMENLRDEMRLLRQDLNTNQDWVAMLHDNAAAARAFWQGLRDAWTEFSQTKDPTRMLYDLMVQMEQQVDALNRTQGSDAGYWRGADGDSWVFNLDYGEGPRAYDMAAGAGLAQLNQDMQTFYLRHIQTLDQRLQAQLGQLRNSQETTRNNIHDIQQYVAPGTNSPNTGTNNPNTGINNPNTGINGPDGPNSGTDGPNSGLDGVDGPDSGIDGPTGGPDGVDGATGGLDGPAAGLDGPSGGLDGVDGPTGGLDGPTGGSQFGATGLDSGASGPDTGSSGLDGGLSGLDDGAEFGSSGADLGLTGAGLDPTGADTGASTGPSAGSSFLPGVIGASAGPSSGSDASSSDRRGAGYLDVDDLDPDDLTGGSDLPSPSTVDPGLSGADRAGSSLPGLSGSGLPDSGSLGPGASPSGSDTSGSAWGSSGGGLDRSTGSQVQPPAGMQVGALGPTSGATGGSIAGAAGGLSGAGGWTGVGATSGLSQLSALAADPAAAFGNTQGSGLIDTASTGSGMPFIPPMGGMGGMGGGGEEKEREKKTWLTEDEDVWGTDPHVVAAVIGRDDGDEQADDYLRPESGPQTPAPRRPARTGGHAGGRSH